LNTNVELKIKTQKIHGAMGEEAEVPEIRKIHGGGEEDVHPPTFRTPERSPPPATSQSRTDFFTPLLLLIFGSQTNSSFAT
jgi:hypothetical protein